MNVNDKSSGALPQAAAIDPFEPTTVAKVRGRELRCESAAGAAWLAKYLHPPCERLDSLCGLPDENNQPSVFEEFRFNRDYIPPIIPNGASPPVNVQADSLLFLQTSIPGLPCLCWPLANGDFIGNASRVQAIEFPAFIPTSHYRETETGRVIYQSVTYSLDSTSFNNQGTVTVSQFRPKVGIEARNNGGTGTLYELVFEAQVPSNAADVAMISSKSYSGLARDGAFVVQRMCQPTNSYKEYHESSVSETSEVEDLPTQFAIRNTVISDLAIRVDDWTGSAQDLRALFSSDLTWAWVLFEGLTIGADTGLPRVNVKAVAGYEFGVGVSSPLTPFIRNSANYDFLALQAATRTTHAAVDAMPAAMNALGSFLVPALKYAPGVISALAPMLQQARRGVMQLFNARPQTMAKKTEVKSNRGTAANAPRSKRRTDNDINTLIKRIQQLETAARPKKRRTQKPRAN